MKQDDKTCGTCLSFKWSGLIRYCRKYEKPIPDDYNSVCKNYQEYDEKRYTQIGDRKIILRGEE
jgi:hypothetical protein